MSLEDLFVPEFEHGERIVVPEECIPHDAANCWKKDLIGRVETFPNKENRITFSAEENNVEKWETPNGSCRISQLRKRNLIHRISCSCESDLLYHDKKEEWFCPFCEKEKLNE